MYIRLSVMALLISIAACTSPPKLHSAIHDNDAVRVRALLEGGADINQSGSLSRGTFRKHTPLMLASRIGNEKIVRILLEFGAAVDIKSEMGGVPALNFAAYDGHAGVVKALLAAGALTDYKSDAAGVTVLMLASEYGHIEVVKVLLAAGASVNLKDHEGRTALSHTMLRNISLVETQALDGTYLGTKISLPPDQEVIFDMLIEANAKPGEGIELLYAKGARTPWVEQTR